MSQPSPVRLSQPPGLEILIAVELHGDCAREDSSPTLAVSRATIVTLGQCQKRKRVRPPGSVPKVTVAERGSMRYTFHGGGPCDGALNGAVMPDPLSSGSAGQPWSAHAFAMRATASGSVTRV